jgi:hypothetical protein
MNIIDFRGRLAIHPGEALYLIGYSRTLQGAKKTARNLIYRNEFPLPLTLVAGHQRVLVPDLVRVLGLDASAPQDAVAKPTIPKRGPGRPRKLAPPLGGAHEQ